MIYPVILSGGSGTRLWPLSRKSYPKQFSHLLGDETLFQTTCLRLTGQGFAKPTIVTNESFRFIVRDAMREIGIDDRAIILEPAARNTAPAILAAVMDIAASDADAMILVLPSDHSVKNVEAFRNAITAADRNIERDEIVTFGIKATAAETGYGYLELAADRLTLNRLTPLVRFVEKPDRASAETMLASGRFLWNAGIFMAHVGHFLALFERFQPHNFAAVGTAIAGKEIDLGFTRPNAEAWAGVQDISFDFAIMEKAEKISVVPVDIGWADLGDWNGVWAASTRDENGVTLAGSASAIDCRDSLLRSDHEELTIVGIGLDNIFAVATGDAVVVGDMSRAQDVKEAVDVLKAKELKQAEAFPRNHRPWGWYETLALGDRFQVKRIVVKPGAALSLQSHNHRSEHWTVVEGAAKVTVDETVTLLGENMSIYVPLGAVHRLENPGKIPLTLIEVQSGPYLGEDDIIRYEDAFGRR